MPHTVDNLAYVVDRVKDVPSGDFLIVVMFHEYDFIESDKFANRIEQKISLIDLENLLTQLTRNSSVECYTFTEISATTEDLYYNRMGLNTRSFLTKKIFGFNY